MGLDFGSVQKAYLQEVCAKTLKMGKQAAGWGILLIALLALQDIYLLDFPNALIWRIVGIVPMFVFLIYAFTYHRQHPSWVIPLNAILMLGIGLMMGGIAFEVFSSVDPPMKLKYGVALGYTGVLFVSLLIAEGARSYLPYIIIIPLAILTIVLLLNNRMDLVDWAFMSNVYIVAIVVMVYARYQEKHSFQEFYLRHHLDNYENNLNKLQSQIDLVSEELRAYNHTVSTDLRNPLRSILMYATLLKEKFKDDFANDDQHNLLAIRENAVNLNQLIDDMLAFSHLADKEIYKQVLDMKELFQQVFENLIRKEHPKRHISFKLGELRHAFGDKVMIRQVVVNLLTNALKYTREIERAEIRVSGYYLDGEYIYQIKDNGVGFEDTDPAKMFLPFTQLEKGEVKEGTGVGLAMVKKIIYRHEGKVWASGGKGQGATFYFTLPEVPEDHVIFATNGAKK